MAQPAILCQNITFRYFEKARPVLENVELSIPAGSISVLMGSSGCGKSTLASVLCGLLPENGGFLSSGTITLFGKPLEQLTPAARAKEISMMFQNPDLQFCMTTLRDELYFCMENMSYPPDEMAVRAEASAKAIGTGHLMDRLLHTLSGGEKQLAVLTCIHLLDAKCILLDEPFANLDPASVRQIMQILRRLCQEQGKTIVAIDHISDHWLGTADRFLLLGHGGKVLCQAETDEEIEAAKPLFREQGVAYPGIWYETERSPLRIEHKTDCIHLKSLIMPDVPEKPKKRKKHVHIMNKESSLLFEGNACFLEGRITAILGTSGCGKTSLFMTLLGQRSYLGEVRLYGTEVSTMRPVELFATVGIAFQNPGNQFVTQNVLEEVIDGLRRRYPKGSMEQLKTSALELLDTCGLRQYQKYSPYMLSQGQQRRLAVLSVLAGGQKLLLLDEPTYGQDYRSACALMDQVRERVRNNGLTVLITTHDRGLAQAYADRIYYMHDRQLIQGGNSQ